MVGTSFSFESGSMSKNFRRFVYLKRVKGRIVAEFKSSENGKPLFKASAKSLEDFLKVLKFEEVCRTEKVVVYATEDEESFDLAVLFAHLSKGLRDRKKIEELKDILLSLHPSELIFWNYKLTNATDKNRVARAFLVLYGLR